ncbi:uncharacterized abhydrolase domain-containing protein DDB_G0269086 [Cebidichthys violaceus]|uniref:uncharacterized abhydrolase domain-containing protein DDB_G0269086 n=1 Tax=Cebidichthys violaceus TaxID=271503 RepID=UPI0035CB9CCB
MRVQCVLPVTLVVSVALMGILKIRKSQYDKEGKENKFQDIKLRVANDVLQGYQSLMMDTENLLQKTLSERKALGEETIKLEGEAFASKSRSQICQTGQTSATEELASVETQLKNLQDEFNKEMTNLGTESDTLKQQLAAHSAVCGFLKAGTQPPSQMCGTAEAPKPEEPKAEAPKPEEPKAEAPKPEEPKAEAPKPEEPKAEASKPEEPKAEAPKPEEPKLVSPKPEEPKAEAPKPEEPKAEAPKPE